MAAGSGYSDLPVVLELARYVLIRQMCTTHCIVVLRCNIDSITFMVLNFLYSVRMCILHSNNGLFEWPIAPNGGLMNGRPQFKFQ